MTWSSTRIAYALATVLAALSGNAGATQFVVLHRFPIAGDGGWDYLTVDAASKRLFSARGDLVQVVDVRDGSRAGEIAGTPGVHGVALAPDFGKGYTSNGRDHSITAFVGCHNATLTIADALDGRLVTKLPIGQGVDANAFDPVTRLVFSAQSDGTLSIVRENSAESFEVQQTVATQRGARTMALSPIDHRVCLGSATFDETPATDRQRPRRTILPGTFMLAVVGAKE